jgi:hypothetical protein
MGDAVHAVREITAADFTEIRVKRICKIVAAIAPVPGGCSIKSTRRFILLFPHVPHQYKKGSSANVNPSLILLQNSQR